MGIFGKFSKARKAAAEQKKAAQSKPAAPAQPYKHVPTHAMFDSLACAPPGANSEEDRQQIKMEMRRRTEMPSMPRSTSGLSAFSVVTKLNRNNTGPSGWTTDHRSRAASPTAPPVPSMPANVPANRTPKASRRTSSPTETSRNTSEQSLLRSGQQSPMPAMPSINKPDTGPALSPLHTGSRKDLGVRTSGSSQMLRPSRPGQWQTETEQRLSDMPQISSSSASSMSSSSRASEIPGIPDRSERRSRPMDPKDQRISGNSPYSSTYRNVDRAGPNAERLPVERQQQQQQPREYSQTSIDDGRNTPRGGMPTPAQQHLSTHFDRRPANDGRSMPRAQRQAPPPQQQPMQYDNPPRQTLRPQDAPALIGLGTIPGQDRLPQTSSRNGYRGNERFEVNNSGYRGTSRVPAQAPKVAPDPGRRLGPTAAHDVDGNTKDRGNDGDHNRQFMTGSAYPHIAAH